MKRKIFNIFITLFILFNFIIVPISVFAIDDLDPINIINSDTYQTTSSKNPIDKGIDKTESFAKKLIANFIIIFRVVGVGIAIIILMSLAAKFIWGSIEQKVEVKKHLIVYVTGAAVFFSASALLGLLQDFIITNLN